MFHGRTYAAGNMLWIMTEHHAFINCFLISIAVHYDSPEVNLISLLIQICSHAKAIAKYYSAFLDRGKNSLYR